MEPSEILRSADLAALRQLPTLAERDRQIVERLVVLSPDAAIATASAIIRTHQGDLHELFFPPRRAPRPPVFGQLAAALVYLALAMTAPGQGKFLPIISPEDVKATGQLAAQLVPRLAAPGPGDTIAPFSLIPDAELVHLLDTFVERVVVRLNADPRWVTAVVYGHASALYTVLARACAEQFRPSGGVADAVKRLEYAARTRDLLTDALAPDDPTRPFDPAKREARIARLRSFGWHEYVASTGRTLRQIADEAAEHGLRPFTDFALTDEWATHGASRPTTGGLYFIRPALVPDSTGLPLWAQEERLRPLQRILAGDPAETGLHLGLGSAEVLLEFAVRTGQRAFLVGRWTRTSNQFDGMAMRLGFVDPDKYAITLFPGARHEEAAGVCPVIELLDPRPLS